MYVANESEDTVALVRFDGAILHVERKIPVGSVLTEIEGPHGLAVSPDGQHWFVSLAHGQPFGKVVRYATGTDEKTGEVTLDLFPATMAISPLTGLLHVVNFNLHGPMTRSVISVVDPEVMVEVGRTTTGVMPHGSHFGPAGDRHYSVAMMSGELFEQDALSLQVRRRLPLGDDVRPTWVALHPALPVAYVAGNGTHEILEVNLDSWQVARRFDAAGAPYNLAVTPDGQYVVATLKGAQAVGLYGTDSGEEYARIETAQPVTHGVVVAPDNRYAFVTSEGIGHVSGAVDAIDLDDRSIVASTATGQQTGGIAFWKIDP